MSDEVKHYPFIQASCGCVVILLDHMPMEGVDTCEAVIKVRDCREDQDLGFHLTRIESKKVLDGRRLTDEEGRKYVEAIGALMYQGHLANELTRCLNQTDNNRISFYSRDREAMEGPPQVMAEHTD